MNYCQSIFLLYLLLCIFQSISNINPRNAIFLVSKMIVAITSLPSVDDVNEELFENAANFSKANAIASKMVYVESELRYVLLLIIFLLFTNFFPLCEQ
jgi:hypothetical protein